MKTGDDFKGIILRKCGGLTKWQFYDTFLLASKSVYISTEHVFALTALLGFRFAPRLRDALSRHLYLVNEMGAYRSLNSLLFGQVKSKLIIEQWEEMRRVASSIRHGTVSASLLMRKLAAYPRQNRVARALTEMGKLEETAYLL